MCCLVDPAESAEDLTGPLTGELQPSGAPVGITVKVAGVHWWFRTRSHAAELTAGAPAVTSPDPG